MLKYYPLRCIVSRAFVAIRRLYSYSLLHNEGKFRLKILNIDGFSFRLTKIYDSNKFWVYPQRSMHKGLRRKLKFYHIRIELGIYFVNILRIIELLLDNFNVHLIPIKDVFLNLILFLLFQHQQYKFTQMHSIKWFTKIVITICIYSSF